MIARTTRRLPAIWPQPLIGIASSVIAILAWIASVAALRSELTTVRVTQTWLVAPLLIAALFVAYRYPIHIRCHFKVVMSTVPRYVLAVLLPPPVALLAVAIGVTAGEMSTRDERGMYLSDIATHVARTSVCALAASWVMHAAHGLPSPAPFALAALTMWAGDILTSPLLLWPITNESGFRIIAAVVKGSSMPEAAQSVLGMFGAVVAADRPWAMALLAVPTVLVYIAYKDVEELHQGSRHILTKMADAVDLRDPYTGQHQTQVAALCRSILTELGRHGPEAELIVRVASVHDIGKIGVPDYVLNKDGRLTDGEEAIMATHPVLGAEMLMEYKDFARGADIVRHHHERWDGQGYPDKTRGEEIPFGARVIAVADSFDAMTSDRPYRRGMSIEQASQILWENGGTQWDSDIVQALLRVLAKQPQPAAQPETITRPVFAVIQGGQQQVQPVLAAAAVSA